jgi:uncharacterized protein (UPF0335 family)
MRIDAERLRGFLDCMHAEADERDKRSAQIREIVKAAKEAGFDTKAVRKVFARERMDEGERARQDDLLETYEGALGPKGSALRAIEAGVPVGEAAAANGVHRATLARARSRNTDVAKQPSIATVANEPSIATPHDPETGEINETRSSVGSTSDSTEPVVPTGNEGNAEERTQLETADLDTRPGGSQGTADNETSPAPATADQSCGGGETAPTTSPAQGPVVSEPDETRLAVAGCASGTSHAQGNRPAGVAPGPQDLIQQGQTGGGDDLPPRGGLTPEPEVARVAPPVFITDAQALAALDEAEAVFQRRVPA